MDPFAFTTEEEGIHHAERALDELRVLLHTTGGVARTAQGSSSRAPPIGIWDDHEFALQCQLSGLEEMLRMITDARLAKTLIEDDDERAMVHNAGDEGNIDLLRIIVMSVQDVMASQTYDNFDPFPLDPESDDAALQRSGTQPLSPDPVVVGRAQTDLPILHGDDIRGDVPPSPLSQFSEELEPERKPDLQIPTCLVCLEELLSTPTARLETPCGHFYCSRCSINLVESYTERAFPTGPLRCCPAPHLPVPPRSVNRFLTNDLRTALAEKIVEFETPHDRRIYCPNNNCRKFIDPTRITPAARAAGSVVCPNRTCRVNICLGCRQLFHRGVNCEKNADDLEAVRIQTQFGLGRCPACGFVVEKIDGCNSVGCRCGSGFTYQPMARN